MTERLEKHGAELREKGQMLLDAAYAYWEVAQKAGTAGALFWLDDDSGRTVIFTRGEYRHTLLNNVDRVRMEGAVVHMNPIPTWAGQERDEEFPEGRPIL